MQPEQLSVDEVFAEAIRRPEGDDRQAYLDEIYGHDAAGRDRMERLLGAHAASRSFLEGPAADPLATANWQSHIAEGPGAIIGPYKLLQQIGEGGMGVVFLAQQHRPIQRTVALKIIKPGMDSQHVIARFEAERQALALMDHPNIARVLDAGTSATGRPYFVMELVKGVPITEYCDAQRLSVRQRLELMKDVCQAVQHAHQKGIIHRDLKPSNVLVAEYDGQPVPRIIDFGVAKAIGQHLAERTLFTQFGQIVGTLEYMSPEQARFNQLDVDTRSDIYSLGVLLYELLAGSTPLEKERLRTAAFDQILHMISDEEPPKPSTRLSSSQSLPAIAASRGLEPNKLAGLLKGDLDWVVMKALEKNRSRRYETASALGQELAHFLADEPVMARPPSTAYRFSKLVRRNKVVFAAGVAFVAALVVGLGVSSWMYLNEKAARARANAAEDRSNQSLKLLQEVLAGSGVSATGDPVLLKEALDKVDESDLAGEALNNLGLQLRSRGRFADAEQLHRRGLAIFRKVYSGDNQEIAISLNDLSLSLWDQGKFDEAEQTLRQGVAMAKRVMEPVKVAIFLDNLGCLLRDEDRQDDAKQVLEQTLAIRKEELGERDFGVAETTFHLAEVARRRGQAEDAERLLREAMHVIRDIPTASEIVLISMQLELATTQISTGKFSEAEALSRDSLKRSEELDSEAWQTAFARSVVGGALLGQKRFDEAEPHLLAGYEGMKRQTGLISVADQRFFRETIKRLVEYYEAVAQPDRVAQWRSTLAEFDQKLALKRHKASQP